MAHCPAHLEHGIESSAVNKVLGTPKSRAERLASARRGLISRIQHHPEPTHPTHPASPGASVLQPVQACGAARGSRRPEPPRQQHLAPRGLPWCYGCATRDRQTEGPITDRRKHPGLSPQIPPGFFGSSGTSPSLRLPFFLILLSPREIPAHSRDRKYI